MEDFRRQTLDALSWSGAAQFVRQLIWLVLGIVLARLLTPRDFGLIAMIVVLTGFASLFLEAGFGSALIQRKDAGERHLSSVFWLNLSLGAALTLLVGAAAPAIARFYGEPRLVPLTRVVSLTFLFNSLGVVQDALFRKRLDFRAIARADIVSLLVSGAAAVVMALRGFGVWSLVVRVVGTVGLRTVLLWTASDWRPRWRFDRAAVGELFGFGAGQLGSRSVDYWARHADDLLIGKVLGSTPLGIYDKAYQVMLFPLTNVTWVIAEVMFPSLALVQEDSERMGRIFLRTTRVIALVAFPLMIGAFVTARPLVLTVLGSRWLGMVPIVRVIWLAGMAESLVGLAGSLYLAQGEAALKFRVRLVVKGLLVAAIIVGLRWGVVGVAIGYTTAMLIGTYPDLRWAGGLVGLRYADILRSVAPALGCGAAMGLLAWVAGALVPPAWPVAARLGVQVATGAASYWMLLRLFRVGAYADLLRVLGEQLRAIRTRSA